MGIPWSGLHKGDILPGLEAFWNDEARQGSKSCWNFAALETLSSCCEDIVSLMKKRVMDCHILIAFARNVRPDWL